MRPIDPNQMRRAGTLTRRQIIKGLALVSVRCVGKSASVNSGGRRERKQAGQHQDAGSDLLRTAYPHRVAAGSAIRGR